MTHFKRQLEKLAVRPKGRCWFYIPYDQLSDAVGPLAREDPQTIGIILIENPWKAAHRLYPKQKLALIRFRETSAIHFYRKIEAHFL